MTHTNPSSSSEQEPLPLGGPTPDPWGMKRVENLITALTGILSARVVTTPLGEVSEVHVLTRSDMQPKQVVRNIESALMAQLGFKIDHRKISVAQTADVRPIQALQEEAISERSKRRVVVFKGLEVRPAERPQRVQVRVTLAFGVGMAVVLSALGLFLYVRVGHDLMNGIDMELRSRARSDDLFGKPANSKDPSTKAR